MTPLEYKERYEEIRIGLNNDTNQFVKVNMYRLAVMPPGHYGGHNPVAKAAFMAKLSKHGVNTEIAVDTLEQGFIYLDPDVADGERNSMRMSTSADGDLPLHGPKPSPNELPNDMTTLAAYVFDGKGTPEYCQIVLQLAHHWGLAPDPQKYADEALGLDCNGFVGNYVWHVKKGKPWTDLGIRNNDLGPDAQIDAFFPFFEKGFVNRWDDLDGSKTYVLGMTKNGVIVKGGEGLAAAGHIMITQPGFVRQPRTLNGRKSQAIYVVESTAGHKPGLWASYYSLKNELGNGVFSVVREAMAPTDLEVKIAELK
jgi:hypothetical protein